MRGTGYALEPGSLKVREPAVSAGGMARLFSGMENVVL